MKQAVEYVRGLRYKLHMMEVAYEEPDFVYGDNNMSVLNNITVPSSMSNKKINVLPFHFIHEGCAHDEWRTVYINAHLSCADLPTKCLPPGIKRPGFIRTCY